MSKSQEVLGKVATTMVNENLAKEKFTFKKMGSFYFIIDSESGKKVGLHGKVFRAKGKTKLANTLYQLREAYKKQLEQEGV